MNVLVLSVCLGAAPAAALLPFGVLTNRDLQRETTLQVASAGIVGDQVPAQYPSVDLHVPEVRSAPA